MKALLYFVLVVCFLLGAASAFCWLVKEMPLDEQIEYVQSLIGESVEDTAVSNTTESATKLGKVLKTNFDEAQDVYQNGAKYSN